ncbi:WD40 repeat-like protein [Coemansia reversa NRRL 1564]|uniref:WD40 repeat-like protein n=1 Tax=Coemansia reversa (strain ATCC 12441 / NRRL 1564) TaxID=763665 RepID=A0A2G5BCK2_COERN|nr:WD40 repeat-like protein [Coemansia reversa NRRL 1564]|eukprot:PIA16740.1 WD40 repeat-like protein [Coemansia reversa NRRL 1564]
MVKQLERTSLEVGIPISCIGVTQSNDVVFGGGGGPGRSGVQNKLAVYRIDDKNELVKANELVLSSDEDAPTCLAIHPKENALVCSVNASKEQIKKGENNNCRLYALDKDSSVKPGNTAMTICSSTDMDYQRCIAFSPSGKLIAGGATNGTLAVVENPSLCRAFPYVEATDEINDVDFNESSAWLVAATDAELKVLSTKDGSLVKSIEDPHTSSGARAVFRFARFGRGKGTLRTGSQVKRSSLLYTVLNTRSRKGAYIVQWDTDKWTRTATRFAAHSPITTFALSYNGELLAFATASLQIAICDAHSLKVLMRIKDAHTFAITALAFDKENRRLISGSADESCRVFVLPDTWPTPADIAVAFAKDHIQIIAMVLALLIAIVAAFSMRG